MPDTGERSLSSRRTNQEGERHIMTPHVNAIFSQIIAPRTWKPFPAGEQRDSLSDLLQETWSILGSTRVQRALAWLIALVLIPLDIALVCHHALVRSQTYHAGAFHLGHVHQPVWQTLQR